MTMQTRSSRPLNASAVGFLLLFAAIIVIAIGKKTGVVDYDLAKRGVAMALGLMLVLAGNALPKIRLFDAPGRDPSKIQSAERFAGWAFVLAGVAYVGIWAFAPMNVVVLLSSGVGLLAFGAVAVSWRRAASGSVATFGSAQLPGEPMLTQRILLATVLLTLLWSVVIFLIDYAWGDAAAQWVSVWYPIILGVVFGVLLPMRLAGRASANSSD